MRKQSEAFVTLYQVAFTPAQKQYWIGLLFTHKNGDLGAISVTERCCAALRPSLKWRVTYRIGVHTIQDSFQCQQNKVSGIG